MPGKKIREKAANALNVWLQVSEADLLHIKHIINLLHNASLILDDVEDGTPSRRGKPAAHMVFGVPQAINSAGYQINAATKEIIKLGDPRCLDVFGGKSATILRTLDQDRTNQPPIAEEMDRLYVGQGHDLFWTFNTRNPSVEEYISMIDCSMCLGVGFTVGYPN